jgi:hypothetical protein
MVHRSQEEFHFVRRIAPLLICVVMLFSGCANPTSPTLQTITSVIPSASGTPNSVTSFGKYEFVSVQGTGQIFTYNISSGSQVLAGPPYATPCADPSGMVATTISGSNVMAVVCYDTGSLLTLTIHTNGSLTALGSVGGLDEPYPGIVLDGTNVLVPLFGHSLVTNGGVAKVTIASPETPVITGVATLASPAHGQFVNPPYLTAAAGYIFIAAGSESAPSGTSSAIEVVNEATMTVVGTPLLVAHSPQQIAVQGNVAYVPFFDATQLESIDVSNPASLKPLQIASLTGVNSSCHALSIAVQNNLAFVGCYEEGVIDRFDVTNPSSMQLTQTIGGVASPQAIALDGNDLLVPSSTTGGPVYLIQMGGLSGHI